MDDYSYIDHLREQIDEFSSALLDERIRSAELTRQLEYYRAKCHRHADCPETPWIKQLGIVQVECTKLLAEKRVMASELARLQAGQFTSEEINAICHDLHGRVTAREFANGCTAEQRKLYGCAPDADEKKQALDLLDKIELECKHTRGPELRMGLVDRLRVLFYESRKL